MTVLRQRREEGFATIAVTAGMSLLLLVFAGTLAIADLVATGSRAGAAADLAVLAAASSAVAGPVVACSRAAGVASANHTRMRSCRLGPDAGRIDADVVVAAEVTGPMRALARYLGLDPPVVRARARAGPAAVP